MPLREKKFNVREKFRSGQATKKRTFFCGFPYLVSSFGKLYKIVYFFGGGGVWRVRVEPLDFKIISGFFSPFLALNSFSSLFKLSKWLSIKPPPLEKPTTSSG